MADGSNPLPIDCSAVLTHHWLIRERGGEKVLRAFRELLPDAQIYTLIYDSRTAGEGWGRVHESLLRFVPGARSHYQKLLPLLPWAARRMRLPPVDLVLCSDAAIAKAMRAHPRSRVVCYCHSPMRYVWDLQEEYRRTLPAALRPLWGPLCRRIRLADVQAAQRVDQFVANSRHVAERIRRAYGRDSIVIHPPVEVPPEPWTGRRADHYLCVGYHVPYKRLDLAVAATRMLGRKLVVIGEGPDVKRIDRARDAHVEHRGWQGPQQIAEALRSARGLLFPGEEDFGIVPVEAMGHGCPVIAYGVGGATESVIPEVTGIWFNDQSADGLAAAIERFETLRFDPGRLHQQAWKFRRERFQLELRNECTDALRPHKNPNSARNTPTVEAIRARS